MRPGDLMMAPSGRVYARSAKRRRSESRRLTRKKRLADARGTIATKLMITSDLTVHEIAHIIGWSPTEVLRICRVYVDRTAVIVAFGGRIKRAV